MGLNADEAPDLTVSLGTMTRLLGGTRSVALYMIARLRDGQSLSSAQVQLRQLWPEVWSTTNPETAGQRPSPAALAGTLQIQSFARGFSVLRGRYRQALTLLVALAVMLLALAAVNVGGLCL